MVSEASLRHHWLKQLCDLKCGAAEAVARYAFTGQSNIELTDILLNIGVIETGWNADTASANPRYQAARRAINKIETLAPELATMGIEVSRWNDGVLRVVAESKNPGMRFFAKTAVSVEPALTFFASPVSVIDTKASLITSKFSGLAERIAARTARTMSKRAELQA